MAPNDHSYTGYTYQKKLNLLHIIISEFAQPDQEGLILIY